MAAAIFSSNTRKEELEESLIQEAQAHFTSASIPKNSFHWQLIEQGGSDREFYRVRHLEGKTWIVMQYSVVRQENGFYPEIARFLQEIHLQVPQILFHDPELRLVGMEDLGDTSLYTFSQQNKEEAALETLYRSALTQALKLHQHTTAPVQMMKGFDETLYHWERNYFWDNLVKQWAGLSLPEKRRDEIETEGVRMVAELMKTPQCLIHRDFQSQNLMVRNGEVWLIDFQGMRIGHAVYDVASLLYDPYVQLKASQRAALLAWYTSDLKVDTAIWERLFYQAAVQRLMQALGAYGFLGLTKGKRFFLQYIPHGLENLVNVLGWLRDMKKTLELVREIQLVAKERLS